MWEPLTKSMREIDVLWKVQLATFEAMLGARVKAEDTRAKMFIGLMRAMTHLTDANAVDEALGLARSIIENAPATMQWRIKEEA